MMMKVKLIKRPGYVVLVVVGFFFLVLTLFLPYHYELYTQTIGRVTHIERLSTERVTDEHGNQDTLTSQQLTIRVENGKEVGKQLQLNNDYNVSMIDSQKYRQGDKVFLRLEESRKGELSGQLIGSKRDEKLVFFIVLFIAMLILIGGRAGAFSLVSLLLNSVLMLVVLDDFIHGKSHQLIGALAIAVPFLIISSLFLVSGWSLKTLAAIIATLLGTFTSFLIGWLVVSSLNHRGLRYEEMEFITRSPHAIFIASLLIGCLGAVMDVAMTIVSTLFEVLEKNPQISLNELKKAGKQVGSDIIGPMSNVLLFSYISGSLPLIIIYLRNQLDVTYTISTVLSLEIARALVGSLGIVLTVPLGIYSVLAVLKWRGLRNDG